MTFKNISYYHNFKYVFFIPRWRNIQTNCVVQLWCESFFCAYPD